MWPEAVSIFGKVKRNIIAMISRIILLAIVAGFLAVMFGVAFDLVEPYLFPLHFAQGKARFVGENVIIGPYPQKNEIKRLKERVGVVEIISLQNKDSIYERNMVQREQDAAEELDIAFRNFPMEVKWFNDEDFPFLAKKDKVDDSPQFVKWLRKPFPIHRNQANLEMAIRVANYVKRKYGNDTDNGIVYINCYFGKHRSEVVLEALKAAGVTTQVAQNKNKKLAE